MLTHEVEYLLDFLEYMRPEVDLNNITVAGHSKHANPAIRTYLMNSRVQKLLAMSAAIFPSWSFFNTYWYGKFSEVLKDKYGIED